jgi:S1-C subfamily serine protease
MAWPLRMWMAGFKANAADGGLRVERLAPDFVANRNQSPAKAGLKANDVIVAIDGKTEPLKNEGALLAYLAQQKKSGEAVKLTVRRGGESLNLNVTVP